MLDILRATTSDADVVKAMKRNDTRRKARQQSAVRRSRSLRSSMRQGQPGYWVSDHREETLHNSGWNYVAINYLARQAMSAHVMVYDDSKKGSSAKHARQRAKLMGRSLAKTYGEDFEHGDPVPNDHPYMELQRRPNPWESGAIYRYQQVQQLQLTGMCLVWKLRNSWGLTKERFVIPTAIAQPQYPSNKHPNGYWRITPYHAWTRFDEDGFVEVGGHILAYGTEIDAKDVTVILWPHALYKGDGHSPTAAGGKWIDTADQIDESRFSHMQHGIDPSAIISPSPEVDWNEEEADRAADRVNSKYSGPHNHGKSFFIPPGSTVTTPSPTPRLMQYDSNFLQMRQSIMALHGVSEAAVGLTQNMTYGSLGAALKSTTQLAVQPILDLIADEDTEQQAPEFGKNLVLEMEAVGFDDPDLLERQLTTDIGAGTITKGEMRKLRGRPLFGDERDDEIAGPAQVVKADETFVSSPVDAQKAAEHEQQRKDDQVMVESDVRQSVVQRPEIETQEQATQQLRSDVKQIKDTLDMVAKGQASETFALEVLQQLGVASDRAQRLVDDAAMQGGKFSSTARTIPRNGSGVLARRVVGASAPSSSDPWTLRNGH